MNNRSYVINKISILGIIINLFLIIVKYFAGVISGSNALLADSLHSFEDMTASVLSFIGAKISAKKQNDKYCFGYGKSEYIFGLLISVFMIVTSIMLVISSIKNIITKNVVVFSYISLIVCLVTIILKFFMCIYSKIKYKKIKSILIKSCILDSRNDVAISLVTMIGIILSYFRITFVDNIIGILIALWIGYTGIKLFISSFEILMDKNINKEYINKIKNDILKNEEVLKIDKICAKPIGSKYILLIVLAINDSKNLKFTVEVLKRIKKSILYKYDDIKDVFIQIE